MKLKDVKDFFWRLHSFFATIWCLRGCVCVFLVAIERASETEAKAEAEAETERHLIRIYVPLSKICDLISL